MSRRATQPARRPRLTGHPHDQPAPQPKVGGWHWTEWGCEYVGTGFQLFLGFCVVALLEAPQSPLRHDIAPTGLRLALIGAAFGILAAVVAVSPLGRRSGAHLNPAVTIGFWATGHTHRDDVVGYAVAQTLGALTAAACFDAAWGAWASGVNRARTVPEPGLAAWGATGIEAALTFGLLFVVFTMLSTTRTARLTPVVVIGLLTGLVWAGANHTGASMNPSRTFGPDVVAGSFTALWVYFVGPPLGALLAAGAFILLTPRRRTLTAKLFHDERYPSTQRTSLPAKPNRSTSQTAGRALQDGASTPATRKTARASSASHPRP